MDTFGLYSIFVFTLMMNFCMPFLAHDYRNLTTDHSALLAFKRFITSDPRIIASNWSDSSSVCTWTGVTCGSRRRRIVALNMSKMNVSGPLPPHLGNLSSLVSLDLSDNHFNGSLPWELSRLFRLKFLNLSVNNLSVEIPVWLGNLNRLESLSLAGNNFNGYIPNSISNLSNLNLLDVNGNSLRGAIPFATFNMSNLKVLSLGRNFFTGQIPNEIGKLKHLEELNLAFNNLTGPIPYGLFNLSSLKTMVLASNKLSGQLPTNMCRNLPFLERVYLLFNHLNGQIPSNLSECSWLQALSLSNNFLSMQIPDELGKLKYLEILDLIANNLTGVIPKGIYNISSLRRLGLRTNELTGTLLRGIGNLTSLEILDLSQNNLSKGVIPQELSLLTQLQYLFLGGNHFVGTIPQGIFNISTLRGLGLEFNSIADTLPMSLGYGLPALEQLVLNNNNISGVIPKSITNCSKLINLLLGTNKFTGFVPSFFGSLPLLEKLDLSDNNLTIEPSSPQLSFLTSLSNCRFLRRLGISNNPLNGIIPTSIGNLSTSLQCFYAYGSKIKGSIPVEIRNLSGLVALSLVENLLTGNLPLSIKYLHNLQRLDVGGNKIRGIIPEGLCELQNLEGLFLRQNQFSGCIPDCLGNITSLRHIFLDVNMVASSIPSSIWLLKDLLELNLSSNSLTGNIPENIGNLGKAFSIDLSRNKISGYIPDTVGQLESLVSLSLGHNRLQGFIPGSMQYMINLESLDLSYNNLSSSIPMSLQKLRFLKRFNVSYNALTGEIPSAGPFQNFTMESFIGNKALCGIARFHIAPCKGKRSMMKGRRLAILICASVISCLTVVSLIFILIMGYKRKGKVRNIEDELTALEFKRFSHYELLQATEQFSESHLLGIGGFGSVYKGTLIDGKVVAVKVFNFQSERAITSFDVECEVLRNIRHRNLNKVLGSCSTEEFKALVLEYMPNGSLEKWLYSQNDSQLDIVQRLNIMIDVAFALEYLHHGYPTPIVHCDMKPSNVLLNQEMIAQVSDFGIAKLLSHGQSVAHTNTLSTFGYIAPEYGLEGLVSTRCDVYSYGIMLIETFTRKRPSDEMFTGDTDIKHWVQGVLLESSSLEAIDAYLLNSRNFDKTMQCISNILKLALKCLVKAPGDRINMMEVVVKLQKIKQQFLE